jgi:acyl-CoA reductase-like NAD-dependent aldehyde dehydrogenase
VPYPAAAGRQSGPEKVRPQRSARTDGLTEGWFYERDRLVRDIEAGGVFFNEMTASHPALPFGGIKRSGYGRELSSHGIREFCNVTTVWIGAGD